MFEHCHEVPVNSPVKSQALHGPCAISEAQVLQADHDDRLYTLKAHERVLSANGTILLAMDVESYRWQLAAGQNQRFGWLAVLQSQGS